MTIDIDSIYQDKYNYQPEKPKGLFSFLQGGVKGRIHLLSGYTAASHEAKLQDHFAVAAEKIQGEIKPLEGLQKRFSIIVREQQGEQVTAYKINQNSLIKRLGIKDKEALKQLAGKDGIVDKTTFDNFIKKKLDAAIQKEINKHVSQLSEFTNLISLSSGTKRGSMRDSLVDYLNTKIPTNQLSAVLEKMLPIREFYNTIHSVKAKNVEEEIHLKTGILYEEGKIGNAVDKTKAISFYNLAITDRELAPREAYFRLANLIKEKKPVLAEKYYESASDFGLLKASIALADMYVEKNRPELDERALELYEKATHAKDNEVQKEAFFKLGALYEELGEG